MPDQLPPEVVLSRLGGVADARTLQRLTTRSRIRTALVGGVIVRDARGRYALPATVEGLRAAHRLSGVASHLTAATLHGWEVKTPPTAPSVTVPRNRRVHPVRREGIEVRWADLRPDEVVAGRTTSPGRTVLDCAKHLDFDEALAVADSALRHRQLTKVRLLELAEGVAKQHRARCRRVVAAADGRAANPFESVLRAIALDVPELHLVPQVEVRGPGYFARPDLVDEVRRLVAEADSFEWHGGRSALAADCRRYNALALDGWLVLRFSWEDVMLRPDYVRRCFEDAARGSVQHAATGPWGRATA